MSINDLAIIKLLYSEIISNVDFDELDNDFLNIINNPNSICLILELEEKPIGMIMCYIRTSISSGKKMIIDEVAVNHNYQGCGYGLKLMKNAIKLAKVKKLDTIELACSFTKSNLHEFYEKLGFKHRMRLYSLTLNS